jgi:hypothetical protein
MNISEECTTVYGPNYEPDGILNPTLYAEAPVKILWLLRESWIKDPFRLVRDAGIYAKMGNSATLHSMAYVTYSIFNQYVPYEKMDYLRDDPEMAEVLRSIAYINVKKVQGSSGSDLGDIQNWFKRGEYILKAQIDECNPDVVIGCKPYMEQIFRWNENRAQPKEQDIIRYLTVDPGKRLLIEAPHPSQRRVRRQVYVDTLIDIIREHFPANIASKISGSNFQS